MLNNGGGGKKKKKKKKPYQLHGCLNLEEVFYLLQNMAPNSKQLTMLRQYACQVLRLIGYDCYGKP